MLQRVKERLSAGTVREGLATSNTLMVVIPVLTALLAAVAAVAVGAVFLVYVTLPRMGLDISDIHDWGEGYETQIKHFLLFAGGLFLLLVGLIVLSIVLTNRALTRFMLRRVEEPLAQLADGAARIAAGDLRTEIAYDRADEFAPVCGSFNRMAARLREAARQAEREEQARRELFAGISHDLRSPLTAVRAYTEALADGVAQTPEDTARYVHKIQVREAELEKLVEALFLYTRMQVKEYPVQLQSVNLLQEAARLVQTAPEEVRVTADLPPLWVQADPALLARVFANLLDNSRKYRRGDAAHVRLSAERAEAGVLLSVTDDGIGVSPEEAERLFAPFYRTDPARQNPGGGSGLGLAIVREAVAHMGGTVRAQAVPEDGLCIQIWLREGEKDGGNSDH